jgi:hypothetical protein
MNRKKEKKGEKNEKEKGRERKYNCLMNRE